MTAPDLDALIERLQGTASKARIMDVFTRDANGNPMKDHGTSWPLVIVGKDLIEQAAAALVQLREENALMGHPPAQIQKLERRAERAEAELARARYQLRWRAEDTGATHYEGCWRDHYGCAMERIKALEGEQK